MKKFDKYFYLILIILIFISCGKQNNNTEKNNASKILTVALGAQPKSLDPALYNEIPALSVTKQIFNTLVGIDEKGELVPELAEKWKFIDDKNLLITLKENIFFHNGEKMTPEDVIFTLEKAKKTPGSKFLVENIKQVTKIDDKTIKIELETTFAPLLYSLSHPLMGIQNKKYTEKNGEKVQFEPLGTGPFKFKKWVSGERIELTAFDKYYLGKSKIDGVIIKIIPENTNRLIALETGEVDISYGIAPIDIQQIEKNSDINLSSELSYATEYILINNSKAPFNNKKFRQALSLAVNKQDIIDAVYLGTATPAGSIVNPNVFGSDASIRPKNYDLKKAKELLKESGITEKKIKIWTNDNATRIQIAQILQSNFKELGIDVSIETLEWGAYLQKSANGEHELLLGGWIPGTGEADNALYPLLHSSSKGARGNRSFYKSEKFDSIIEKARLTTNKDERKKLYGEAQKIVVEDVPLVPIVYKKESVGLRKNIKGFGHKPNGIHVLYTVEKL